MVNQLVAGSDEDGEPLQLLVLGIHMCLERLVESLCLLCPCLTCFHLVLSFPKPLEVLLAHMSPTLQLRYLSLHTLLKREASRLHGGYLSQELQVLAG